MDTIKLNQMQFYGYHGMLPQENHLGQRFNIDVELHADLKEAAVKDDVTASINYSEAYDIVKQIAEGAPKQLIEALAETIANTLLTDFNQLSSCTVKVIKPDAPIAGHLDSVSVEIYREQSV